MTTYTTEARKKNWFGDSYDSDYLLFADGEQVGTIAYKPLAELICQLLNQHQAGQQPGEPPATGHLWGPGGGER